MTADAGWLGILKETYGYVHPAVVGALERRLVYLRREWAREAEEQPPGDALVVRVDASAETCATVRAEGRAEERRAAAAQIATLEQAVHAARASEAALRGKLQLCAEERKAMERARDGREASIRAARHETYELRQKYEPLAREHRATRRALQKAEQDNELLVRMNGQLRAECDRARRGLRPVRNEEGREHAPSDE